MIDIKLIPVFKSNIANKKSDYLNQVSLRPCLKADQFSFSSNSKINVLPSPKLSRNITEPFVNPEMIEHLGKYIAAFNPAAIADGKGGSHILIRGVTGENYPDPPFKSELLYAHSKDGKIIDKKSIRVLIKPNEIFPYGFEDPRITKIDNKYYIVCTGYDGKFPRICLWTTSDLASDKYKFEGPIGPTEETLPKGFDDKDAFLHAEKVNGKFMLYHRIGSNIQAVFADDIEQLKDQEFWKKQIENLDKNIIIKNKPGTWENKLGGGPPPIKTKEGWLMLYHSSDKSGPGRQYRGGLALLDFKNPLKVIARAPNPIIEPETIYEKNGTVPGVVFPQGLVQKGDNLLVYYGCGDKNVGLAETKVSELLKYVKQFDAEGQSINQDCKNDAIKMFDTVFHMIKLSHNKIF